MFNRVYCIEVNPWSELRNDVFECESDAFTSPVDDLDNLIQDDEGRLQAGQLNKGFNGSGVGFPAALYLLATFTQPSETEIVTSFGHITLKGREKHSRYVVLFCSNSKSRRFG